MKKKVIKKIEYLPIDIAIGPNEQFELDFSELNDVECECGSEKTYGKDATHVDWCPKYKK
jgi:hypothetical protein